MIRYKAGVGKHELHVGQYRTEQKLVKRALYPNTLPPDMQAPRQFSCPSLKRKPSPRRLQRYGQPEEKS